MRAAADNYQPPLPLGEGWGEGEPCNAPLKPLSPSPSLINGRGAQSPLDLRASA
jgi:hypothetical protein